MEFLRQASGVADGEEEGWEERKGQEPLRRDRTIPKLHSEEKGCLVCILYGAH